MSKVKIGLVQMSCTNNKKENLQKAMEKTKEKGRKAGESRPAGKKPQRPGQAGGRGGGTNRRGVGQKLPRQRPARLGARHVAPATLKRAPHFCASDRRMASGRARPAPRCTPCWCVRGKRASRSSPPRGSIGGGRSRRGCWRWSARATSLRPRSACGRVSRRHRTDPSHGPPRAARADDHQ